MKNNAKKVFLLSLVLKMCVALFAQDSIGVRMSSTGTVVPPDTVLADAYNAYSEGDYQSAIFLFRKALSDGQNQSADDLYMLIMAGMHSGEYRAAYADAEYFLSEYPQSEYAPLVKYQQGRALFYMEDYDNALIVLGDFCHENPDNMMYASALFLIGECFYIGYNFDKAEPFYQRVVTEFPKEQKAVEAKYRLDAISARKREQKLLYMLQETGENYLSSRENYEKTLRRYELENSMGDKSRPSNAYSSAAENSSEIFVFEEEAPVTEQKQEVVQPEPPAQEVPEIEEPLIQQPQIEETPEREEFPAKEPDSEFDSALRRLKRSALEAEILLNSKEGK